MRQLLYFSLLFCATFLLGSSHATIQCLNEEGNPVDWWFIHKLPYLPATDWSEAGFAYSYMDPSTPYDLTGKRLDNNLRGALGATLSQYLGKTGPGYLVWNDQKPDDTVGSRAHAKGLMAFDSSTGFFLRHSIPRFPEFHEHGPYQGLPVYEKLYGQTLLCVSVTLPTINHLASQMLVNNPTTYDSYVPREVGSQYPNISRMANGDSVAVSSSIINFKSIGGTTFTDFAKSRYCQCELYSDLVAPHYASEMAVLSWGRPLMGPGCRPAVPFDVLNIKQWQINSRFGSVLYNETKEHSKLALVKVNHLICAGDINRMTSQAKRGGGVTCFTHPGLWTSLVKEIGSWQECE